MAEPEIIAQNELKISIAPSSIFKIQVFTAQSQIMFDKRRALSNIEIERRPRAENRYAGRQAVTVFSV